MITEGRGAVRLGLVYLSAEREVQKVRYHCGAGVRVHFYLWNE